MHDTITPASDDLVTAMRQFILDQAESRTDETRQRYVQVADDLEAFIAGVDVTPWLGAELATHLERERVTSGGTLLTTLGLVSFLRVLPGFLEDPWLAPPGVQRRAQRAVVRYLMTFLRMRAKQEGHACRDDFAKIDHALRRAHHYPSDHPVVNRDGKVACSVTLDLVEHLVDRMLEEIGEGRFETLEEAIEARINPVQVTVWTDPGYDSERGRYGW